MARFDDTAVQLQALKDKREEEENRHEEAMRAQDEAQMHGRAGRKWLAAEQANRGRILSTQADMAEEQSQGMHNRNRIAGFGANMDTGRATTYFGDGSQQTRINNEDALLRQGYDDIVAGANAAKADRARRGRATLSSIYGHALDNGGMVPRELAASVGQELGQPGFVGGTIAPDGTFMTLGRGKDGNIQPTGLVSAQDALLASVQSGDVKTANKIYKNFIEGKLTKRQAEQATGYSEEWAHLTAEKNKQRRLAEIEKILIGEIQALLKEKPETTPGDAWRTLVKNNPKALGEYMTRRAAEGEVGDESGNVELSPEEGYKKFEALWNQGNSGAAKPEQSGDPRLDRIGAIFDMMERMNAPAPRNPDVVAMERRNAARRNVFDAAGGQQKRILERLPNGQLVETNGYVVDGKVYDANGDERQGEFLDEYRRPISPAAQGGAPLPTVSGLGGAPQAQEGGGQLQLPARTPEALARAREEKARRETEKQSAQAQPQGSAAASAEDEKFLDDTLGELEPPPHESVDIDESLLGGGKQSSQSDEDEAERIRRRMAEDVRRSEAGAEMRKRADAAAAEERRRNTPLSEMAFKDIPGEAARRTWDWAKDDVAATGRNIVQTGEAAMGLGNAVADLASTAMSDAKGHLSDMANMTPAEVMQNARGEVRRYLGAVKRALQAQMKADSSGRVNPNPEVTREEYDNWVKMLDGWQENINDEEDVKRLAEKAKEKKRRASRETIVR